MLDTHAIARSLTDAGIPASHADAITAAVRQAAEHDNAAEPLATVRALSMMETRIYRAMLVQAGVIVAAVVAIIRLLD